MHRREHREPPVGLAFLNLAGIGREASVHISRASSSCGHAAACAVCDPPALLAWAGPGRARRAFCARALEVVSGAVERGDILTRMYVVRSARYVVRMYNNYMSNRIARLGAYGSGAGRNKNKKAGADRPNSWPGG